MNYIAEVNRESEALARQNLNKISHNDSGQVFHTSTSKNGNKLDASLERDTLQ